MSYYQDIHHRRSTRLAHHDYTIPGAYFVTICTQSRKCLFPNSLYTKKTPDPASSMLEYWYRALEEHFTDTRCDSFVAMPNHVHFIVFILDKCTTPLFTMVQWFKTMTTNAYIRGVRQLDWQPFRKRLWQRNYYEHVIRSESELNGVRDYINSNPGNWASDPDNPALIKD